MTPGDRVLIAPLWSTFCGHRGTVTQTKPYLMVRLDGDKFPMRFGEIECVQEREVSLQGLVE